MSSSSRLKKIPAPHSSDISQELGAALFYSFTYGTIYAKEQNKENSQWSSNVAATVCIT